MKKIIAFVMSALLAVSAAALPVAAEPAVTFLNEITEANLQQARPVSAEELAQVRPEKSITVEETAAVAVNDGSAIGNLNAEADLSLATVTPKSKSRLPAPVLVDVTASTIVFEKAGSYRYFVSDGYWSVDSRSNVITNLKPNTVYQCYLYDSSGPLPTGESITVTTLDRIPCITVPKAPIVKEHSHDSITLVSRPGYEYRMNDGPWQSSPLFTGLEPETEYTFYQRIKQSNAEFASEVSEPLIGKTGYEGPSSSSHMKQLRKYIEDNGFVDEEGNKALAYVITDEYATEYYFLLVLTDEGVWFNVFSYSEASDVLLFNTEFPLNSNDSRVRVDFSAALYTGNECIDYAEDYYELSMYDYHIGDPLSIYVSGDYLTAKDLSSLWSMTTEMLFAFWDEYIYNALGFGFRGLGFVATEGFGDFACHAPLQVHYGETVLMHPREVECVIEGTEGVPYCTLCGQKIRDSYQIPCRWVHQFDNGCDVDCNDCGELRNIRHTYKFACAEECSVCGAARTAPLAEHTYNENRTCTKCGDKQVLIGDVSVDGKVTIGDVSMAYAHVKESVLLTDNDALTAADTNGDGKLTIVDVSRLYGHVKGTRPLW